MLFVERIPFNYDNPKKLAAFKDALASESENTLEKQIVKYSQIDQTKMNDMLLWEKERKNPYFKAHTKDSVPFTLTDLIQVVGLKNLNDTIVESQGFLYTPMLFPFPIRSLQAYRDFHESLIPNADGSFKLTIARGVSCNFNNAVSSGADACKVHWNYRMKCLMSRKEVVGLCPETKKITYNERPVMCDLAKRILSFLVRTEESYSLLLPLEPIPLLDHGIASPFNVKKQKHALANTKI